jgi:formylglycine-generating enzyme required for sulfatase activity
VLRGPWMALPILLAGVAACASPSGAPAPSTSASPAESAATASASITASVSTAADPAATASASADPTATASADPTAVSAGSAPTTLTGPCPAGMLEIAGGPMKRHKAGKHKTVTVTTYCLDKTEVTVAAYKACVRDKKCSPRCLELGRCTAVPTDADWPDKMETIRASMFCNGTRNDRDDHPVNCVSFDEAKGYCQSYDKRLPTGDEWEWAAVANKPVPVFPWGQKAPAGGDLCWGKPYKRSLTCLPGSYAPDTTRDGVVDMAGNLSEWVVEGTAEKPLRRLRGSSWYAIDDGYIEAALWGFESTSTRSEVFGFRCARDVSRP